MNAAFKQCPQCTSLSAPIAAFCQHCGYKLADAPEQVEPIQQLEPAQQAGQAEMAHYDCPNCGYIVSSLDRVCHRCGNTGSLIPTDRQEKPPARVDNKPLPSAPPASAPLQIPHIQCVYCRAWVPQGAPSCPYCNAVFAPPISSASVNNNQAPVQQVIIHNVQPTAPQPYYAYGRPRKDRVTAGVLAILLGGLGAQRFYLGQTGLGILSLLFFWTWIPALIGLIEGIVFLCMSEPDFHQKYG